VLAGGQHNSTGLHPSRVQESDPIPQAAWPALWLSSILVCLAQVSLSRGLTYFSSLALLHAVHAISSYISFNLLAVTDVTDHALLPTHT
jgi:hypothetical protein